MHENLLIKENNKFEETLNYVRENIKNLEYLFFQNETNVRTEIVERILQDFGWNFPNLNREVKGEDNIKVDIVLYKDCENIRKCEALVEVKSIEKDLDKYEFCRQLMDYMGDKRFESAHWGVLTNGCSWIVYDRKGNIVRNTDVLLDSVDDVKSFFSAISYNNIDVLEKAEHINECNGKFDRKTKKNISIYYNNREKICKHDATKTFKAFIEHHINLVKNLQDNNCFPVKILSNKATELRNSSPCGKKIEGMRWYITGDHSTYCKLMLIKQIINAGNICAEADLV